jgi:hypothetical protein
MTETVYAIIESGLVTNTIVADAAFVARYFPDAIRVDTLSPQPGVAWTYASRTFSHTVTEERAFDGSVVVLPATASLNALTSADGTKIYSATSDYTISGTTITQVASGLMTSGQKVLVTYTLTVPVGV